MAQNGQHWPCLQMHLTLKMCHGAKRLPGLLPTMARALRLPHTTNLPARTRGCSNLRLRSKKDLSRRYQTEDQNSFLITLLLVTSDKRLRLLLPTCRRHLCHLLGPEVP